MSVSANVEGARVLTTMDVPRAVSGQLGSGSGVVQRFKSSMVNIVYSFWLGDSNEVSSIQWGMRAPPLYYRSCVSDGAWLFVAARAPHHMIRIGLVVPKKRKYLDLLVVGLGAALCGPKTSLYGVKPVVVCTVVL